MGKGYNNYMCKKPFHPGSKENIKRAWMAEQRTENEKQKQIDLRVQYEKEQELYNNKALISKDSKDKIALNFMYEAPPGVKKEHQREDDEPEFKFEWQRKYNAPREDFAKDNKDIRDQPFGIPVRNVRCIKCHNWGHINTDRECPLFNKAHEGSMPSTSMDPLELMRDMRSDGLLLKKSALGYQINTSQPNQRYVDNPAEEDNDPELEFLKSLSTKDKQKLLRKLNKLAEKQSSRKGKKKKHKHKKTDSSDSERESKKKKKSKKRKHQSSSSDSDSDSDSSDDNRKKKKRKHKKRDSSSDSSSNERVKKHKHKDKKSRK